ncbi:MAG: sulfotransferase domain-containing protein [Candidatus Brocadiia bacterium]
MMRWCKEKIKALAAQFNYYIPRQEDILLLSSPRSGSTWLMELIYTQPRVKFIFEPLGKDTLDYNDFLPIQTRWDYVSLSPREEQIMQDYFVTDDPIGHFGPRNPLNPHFSFRNHRRVIKVIRANALIKWFYHNTDFRIVYLFRHPIPTGLSAMKRGHHTCIESYLKHLDEKYLPEQGVEIIQPYIGKKTLLAFVTEWCLGNIVPLRYIKNQNPDIAALSYEELVMYPTTCIKTLAQKLDLPRPDKMLRQHSSPSRTTDSSSDKTVDKVRSQDRKYLIRKWREEVSSETRGKAFDILDAFDIDVYKHGRLMPARFLGPEY